MKRMRARTAGADDREARLVGAAGLDVDSTTAFRWGFDLAVPKVSGVYVIADLRGPLYVGKTGELRRRYNQHLDASHNRLLRVAIAAPAGAITFSWCTTAEGHLTDTEIRYIQALRPLCNQHLIIHSAY